MPYRDGQVAEYGPSFARWGVEELQRMLTWLRSALPVQQFALVVYHDISQTTALHDLLKGEKYEYIQVFFLAKSGCLLCLTNIIRCDWPWDTPIYP